MGDGRARPGGRIPRVGVKRALHRGLKRHCIEGMWWYVALGGVPRTFRSGGRRKRLRQRFQFLIVATAMACAACGRQGASQDNPAAGGSGSDGASPLQDNALPAVLYDRGDNVPTIVTEHEDALYWVESSPEEGPIVVQAPKDGSAEPEKIGTRSPYDVAHISANTSYVFWQDNGALVAYDLKAKARLELGRHVDDGYGGPSLAVGDDWVAYGDSSCRAVATVNLKTREVFYVKFHRSLRGGLTSLASIGQNVYCSNGPEIARTEVGASAGDIVWTSPDDRKAVYGVRPAGKQTLVFQLARSSGSVRDQSTSLWSLDLDTSEARELREFVGVRRMAFVVDQLAFDIIYGEAYGFAPLSVLNVLENVDKTLPGQAFLNSTFSADAEYLYWTEEAYKSGRPAAKNAIYRQRKLE